MGSGEGAKPPAQEKQVYKPRFVQLVLCEVTHSHKIHVKCRGFIHRLSQTGTEPFRSQANSLPGANRPIGLWLIRSLANSLPGPFVPWNFRSLELSLRGPFAPDGQNHYLS